MPAKLDLKTNFIQGLESRGIPRAQHASYLVVLTELSDYLAARAPTQWSHEDLEAFMTRQAPRVAPAERPIYGVSLAMLAAILAAAESRGAELYLDLADGRRSRFDGTSSAKIPALASNQVGRREPDASEDDGLELLEAIPLDAPSPPQPDGDLGLLDAPQSPAPAADDPRVEIVMADSGDRIEFVDDDELDEPLTAPGDVASRRTQPMLRKPDIRRRTGPRISQNFRVPGWHSRHRLLEEDGELVVDDRYVLGTEVPQASAFEVRRTTRPGTQEEFLASHRSWLLAAGAVLAAALLGFVVHWALGIALVALMLVAAIALLLALASAQRLDRGDVTEEDPCEAARHYIASLRVGLYHRARTLLAAPRDTAPLSTEALLAAGSGQRLGARFNTLSPAGLRVYWQRHIAELDDIERGRLGRLVERYLRPARLHVEELMRRDDTSAAFVVVRAGNHDDYVVLPMVELAGAWYVADGQCRLQSSRVELLKRLGRRHVTGKIDDDGFVAACRRHNLTRADITRGCVKGALSEAQASMLVKHAMRAGREQPRQEA